MVSNPNKSNYPITLINLIRYGESDSQYSASGEGIAASHGWIETQSLFNLIELWAQLAFLFFIRKNSIQRILTILLVSTATLWKTLLYMSIIAFSPDPVRMVPLLACLGYNPLPENAAEVASLLVKDNCGFQFFKFQFNFWWYSQFYSNL